MGFLISLIAMLVLHLFTPYWWWIIVVPLGVAFWRSDSGQEGFRTGAASAGLLWLSASLYYYFYGGKHIADRFAEMLGTPTGYSIAILAALVAILTGGISGIAGYHFRDTFRRQSQAKS